MSYKKKRSLPKIIVRKTIIRKTKNPFKIKTTKPKLKPKSKTKTKPSTHKTPRRIKPNIISIVSHQEQGRRDYMEDEIFIFKGNSFIFTCVFDGHGGGDCSKFLKRYCFSVFKKNLKLFNTVKKSLLYTVKDLHKGVLKNQIQSGSTLNIIVVNRLTNHFFVANVGDSRAIVCFKNNKIKQITRDHKPENKREKTMIRKKGGFVENGRANGVLAMSRSIGDARLSRHISQTPDIFEGNLANVNFILHATDGLYDVMSNVDICQYIMNLKSKNISKSGIVSNLVRHSIYNKQSRDNVSAIILFFN